MALPRHRSMVMTLKKTVVLCLSIVIGIHALGFTLQAQSGDKFKGRLSPVPALGIPAASVAGVGSASATLSGRKLTVSGAFEKMASAATAAHLCLGAITGARGDSVFDLMVSKTGDGTSGTIAGTFDLTPDQVDALKKGRFYVQIHSTGAPNGHLLGWLLK
jgi:CHRD domain-containing protein